MPEFFQTKMGQVFYEGTMPRIAKSLERIAERLTPSAQRKGLTWELSADYLSDEAAQGLEQLARRGNPLVAELTDGTAVEAVVWVAKTKHGWHLEVTPDVEHATTVHPSLQDVLEIAKAAFRRNYVYVLLDPAGMYVEGLAVKQRTP